MAQCVGAVGQLGSHFLQRPEDDLVVGEIGGVFVDEEGTIEIGYAVVESQWNRGYATAAVEALVTKAREASEVRRIVAHTPLERPESGRVLEKAGFAMVHDVVAVRVRPAALARPDHDDGVRELDQRGPAHGVARERRRTSRVSTASRSSGQ